MNIIFLLLASDIKALNNGLSLTPPIGWNSWYKFGCNVNEGMIKEIADANFEVWSKQLKDSSRAVVLFNRSKSDEKISVTWNEIGYPNHLYAKVCDLWLKKDLGKFEGKFSAKLLSQGGNIVTNNSYWL